MTGSYNDKVQRWVRGVWLSCFLVFIPYLSAAQEHNDSITVVDGRIDRVVTAVAETADSLITGDPAEVVDNAAIDAVLTAANELALPKTKKKGRDWATWQPDPKRAMWLAMVIPGAGQIYNRKYWKLPLVYGGFMGCIYAMTWNNGMYKDYSQAYLDLSDDDPGTRSYEKFAHLGRQITNDNTERYKTLFKKRRDRFRRWRDLSFFVMIGVYAVSVIDAYVDAELSVFDISKDLSLRVEPALIPSRGAASNPIRDSSLGLNCSLNF